MNNVVAHTLIYCKSKLILTGWDYSEIWKPFTISYLFIFFNPWVYTKCEIQGHMKEGVKEEYFEV